MLASDYQRLPWRHVLGVALCFLATSRAQEVTSSGPFLNVNGKYVLYSYPAAPYARHGVMYAPLVSFSELLGIRVTQAANSGRITLLMNGKTYLFRKSGAGLAGGSAGQLHVPTERLPNGELAVALPPLLDALKIPYRADTAGLRITDQRFLNPRIPSGQQKTYANGLPNRYKSWDYYFVDTEFPESLNFIPTRFSLTQSPNRRLVEAHFKLRQSRRPGSGISMLVYNSNNTNAVKGDGLKPPPEPPPLPPSSFCQYTATTVLCKLGMDFNSKFTKDVHVQYVLVHAFNTP